MFRGVGIKLIDFKLQFGRLKFNGKDEVILADEISPDTCRLWDSITEKKLDKDRFRKDLGDLIPAYTEVAKRLGIEEGTVLERPLIEYCLKDDKLGDPIISREHILTFNWLNVMQLDWIDENLSRLNDFLLGMFRGVGIKLVDFKVEFGFTHESEKTQIILADEISPDTCRLWDTLTDKKLDKDRFRKDLGDLIPAYTEVAKRLGILHEQSNVSAVNVTQLSSVKRKKK